MEYFDKDILQGLDKIPAPNYPGVLIVTGKSQAVFTGNNAGDTFLAACKYDNGKIFVSAHDCYLNWLQENDKEITINFMNHIKYWLTGSEDLPDNKIIDFAELVKTKASFDDYQLVKWHHDFDPTEKDQKKLLDYLKNGGSLFCGTTPWGYLQIYPDRKLNDMVMFNFLKKHTGIILTSKCLDISDELNVSDNMAKYSNFDLAIQKISSKNSKNMDHYHSTINNGIDILKEEGLYDDKMNKLKSSNNNSNLQHILSGNNPEKTISNMEYFDKDILQGLDKIPTPNYPGVLIVTGKSQAVFTGKNAGDTFLAACKYDDGKIFVSAHDCYLNWLQENDKEITINFMNHIKNWLTGSEDLPDNKIIDFAKLAKTNASFDDYQLVKWHHDFDPTEKDQKKLLDYLKNGGSLFCGTTPWGYLHIYPDRKLNDMVMFNFLKKHTGIILTSKCLHISEELNVSDNMAKYSNFDLAIQKISSKNSKNIDHYYSTIHNGIDILKEEGLYDDKMNKLISSNTNLNLQHIPSENNPVKSNQDKQQIKRKMLLFTNGEKAPGINKFPGDFDEQPQLLQNIELVLEAKFEERLSTGYYLPAGVELLVKVVSGEIDGWLIRIGAHSDDNTNCESYKRWPNICIVKKLSTEMSLYSPFGGLVYLESPNSAGIVILNISNVVESPYYDLNVPETVSNWKNRKYAPGLWAELAGQYIIFTTPSSCIRHIENPKDVIQFWDKVVRTHHECRGSNVNEYKRERVVNDMQPVLGYMHSGYPIATHLDCCQPSHHECIFDIEKLKNKGNWGLFHEIGHNLQRSEWTFDGTVEVTCNIFSMHANQFVRGQNVIEQEWLLGTKDRYRNYFSKKPTYNDWNNNCEVALMLYAQLIKHFGWEPMHKFMKNYEEDIKNHSDKLPKNNQEKIDQWVIRYSKIISKNITEHFKMFGLPVSNEVNSKLNGLKNWCSTEDKDPDVFFS